MCRRLEGGTLDSVTSIGCVSAYGIGRCRECRGLTFWRRRRGIESLRNGGGEGGVIELPLAGFRRENGGR